MKGSLDIRAQQVLNEFFATDLLDRIGWKDFVRYYSVTLTCDGLSAFGCYSFAYTSENVESVSLLNLFYEYDKLSSATYKDCLDLCENKLGMKRGYVKDFLDRQIAFDYLISNNDRHMRNIEILRDSNTLEVLGMAPMFDFGNSMYFRGSKAVSLPSSKELTLAETHSFSKRESALLRHIAKDIQIDLSGLGDKDLFMSIYSTDTLKNTDFYEALYEKVYLKKLGMLGGYLKGV